MDCPRTGKPMEEVDINGIKIDVSTGCGGIWFDNFELQKFDEPHESAGEQLIELMEKYRNDSVNLDQRIKCPKHSDVVMRRNYFSVKQKTEIDECAECAGIWLDPGELVAIRSAFPDEEARQKAGQEFIKEVFNDPEILAMKAKGEEDLKKARRFANMFKFICPTYYIPGDQEWGAF